MLKQLEIPEGYVLNVRQLRRFEWEATLRQQQFSGRFYTAYACLTRRGAIREVLRKYREDRVEWEAIGRG
jgi:hypothetical protein